MRALGLLLIACGACGAPPDDDVVDAGVDARPDAPPGCTVPALDAAWLPALLGDVVDELTATPRATTSQRDAARTQLTARLTALGWTPQLHSYPGGANVHATIPATIGTGKAVIVGAHFDSVTGSPGANDNASGVAVVVALARYLVDTPCRTAPVTLVFLDQEEAGLFGARAFAQLLDPAAVRAVHTIDQVAWDGDNDRRFELELPTPELAAEWRAAAATLGVTVTETSTSGTDHEAFRDLGFAAVGLTEEYVAGDTSPHRHLATDTAATVATGYHALAAQLTAEVVLREVAP